MVYDLPAVTEANTAAHALAATRTSAHWLQVTADRNNAGNVWIGGSTVAANRGIPIPAGGSQFFPPISDGSYLDLATVYYAFDDSGTTDKFYIIYGRK